MDCQTCREALSARLDGEAEPAPADRVDAHLAGCAACALWFEQAGVVTRHLRVRPTVRTPDLADAVLAATSRRRAAPVRIALAVVAALQVSLGLAQIAGVGEAGGHAGHAGAPLSAHLFNESTAWNLALGLGMLWAALRPRTVSGMLPVLAGFVVVLSTFSVHDLVIGATTVSRVSTHVILIVGLALMVALHRGERGPRPVRPDQPNEPDLPLSGGTREGQVAPDRGQARPPRLRPVRGKAA